MDKYYDNDLPSDAIVGNYHKRNEFFWGNRWGRTALEDFGLREENFFFDLSQFYYWR